MKKERNEEEYLNEKTHYADVIMSNIRCLHIYNITQFAMCQEEFPHFLKYFRFWEAEGTLNGDKCTSNVH